MNDSEVVLTCAIHCWAEPNGRFGLGKWWQLSVADIQTPFALLGDPPHPLLAIDPTELRNVATTKALFHQLFDKFTEVRSFVRSLVVCSSHGNHQPFPFP